MPGIHSELPASENKKTWKLVPWTDGNTIPTSKWVFKVNEREERFGNIVEKPKDLMVMRGFQKVNVQIMAKHMPL